MSNKEKELILNIRVKISPALGKDQIKVGESYKEPKFGTEKCVTWSPDIGLRSSDFSTYIQTKYLKEFQKKISIECAKLFAKQFPHSND